MSKFQQLKNSVNILTGKTSRDLLRDFMVIASSKDKAAKLCFIDKSMQYEEELEHAKKRKANIEHTIPFPTEVRNIFRNVKKKQKQLEEIGMTDIDARGSDITVRNGKAVHVFWLWVPIDEKHPTNARIVNQMLKKDKDRSMMLNFCLHR